MKRFRLSLKLSVLVTLSVVLSLLAVDWLTRGEATGVRQSLLLLYLVLAGIGAIVFAAVLDQLVTRPLQRLVSQVRKAAKVGWEQPLIVRGSDEIAELGDALETLRCSVVEQEARLQELNQDLEDRVHARTRELERTMQELVQAEKFASLGQLSAGVAHEVNNPVGVILSRAGYLLSVADDEGLDPDVIDDLQVIEHHAKRVADILGDLLHFGRPTATLDRSVALDEVARLTLSVLRAMARQSGVELHLEIDDPEAVAGDRDRLEQVIFNLVKNAVQATPSGGQVDVRVEGSTLVVEDFGVGMEAETLSRIFEPFYTTKDIGDGTGLGLSIVHGIIEAHHGRIDVTSRLGEGTRIVVTLPTSTHSASNSSS